MSSQPHGAPIPDAEGIVSLEKTHESHSPAHRRLTVRRVAMLIGRVMALAGAAYLLHALFSGSGVLPRERTIFWASFVAAFGGLASAFYVRRIDPVRLTLHVLAAVAAVTFVATLVTYGDPALLRFGHAIALGTGNAVTLGVITWLASMALRRGGPPTGGPEDTRLRKKTGRSF
jgi:hypothetical protein